MFPNSKVVVIAIGLASIAISLTSCSNERAREVTAQSDYLSPADYEIGRGKTFEFSKNPNYSLTTDPNDSYQLADGIVVEGRMWIDKNAVGWMDQRTVRLSVDLGREFDLSRIRFRSAAHPRADVYFPKTIIVTTSLDGQKFESIGDLVPDDLVPFSEGDQYEQRTFELVSNAYARWVEFDIVPSGRFLFVDEIEIYGDSATVTERSLAKKVTSILGGVEQATKKSAKFRALEDWNYVHVATQRDPIVAETLDALQARIPEFYKSWRPPEDFETTFPQTEIHAEIFRTLATYWSKSGVPPLTVWNIDAQDRNNFFSRPQPGIDKSSLTMAENETRSVSVNVTSLEDQTIRINYSSVPVSIKSAIRMLVARVTDTTELRPERSVLEEVACNDSVCSFSISAGITVELWVEVSSTNVLPGMYQVSILINNLPLTIELTIEPVAFDETMVPKLSGWDYSESRYYGISDDVADEYARLLKSSGVGVIWGLPNVMQHGKYRPTGNMSVHPDTTKMSAWLKRWGPMKQHAIYLAVNNKFAGFDIGSKTFDNAVSEWVNWWADWLSQRPEVNLPVAVLLVDEPRSQKDADLIASFGRHFSKKSDVFQIVTTLIDRRVPYVDAIVEASDIVVPLSNRLLEQQDADWTYFSNLSRTNEIWLYSVLEYFEKDSWPNRARAQFWMAQYLGARGVAFWSFSDSGHPNSWNQYATGGVTSSPFYVSPTAISHTIESFAIRDGYYDYTYFEMLKDALSTTSISESDPRYREASSYLLESAKAVVESQRINYNSIGKNDLLEVRRLKLLDHIVALSN